jgi:hypothetical protein
MALYRLYYLVSFIRNAIMQNTPATPGPELGGLNGRFL